MFDNSQRNQAVEIEQQGWSGQAKILELAAKDPLLAYMIGHRDALQEATDIRSSNSLDAEQSKKFDNLGRLSLLVDQHRKEETLTALRQIYMRDSGANPELVGKAVPEVPPPMTAEQYKNLEGLKSKVDKFKPENIQGLADHYLRITQE